MWKCTFQLHRLGHHGGDTQRRFSRSLQSRKPGPPPSGRRHGIQKSACQKHHSGHKALPCLVKSRRRRRRQRSAVVNSLSAWWCWQFAKSSRVSLATLCVCGRILDIFSLVIFRPSFCTMDYFKCSLRVTRTVLWRGLRGWHFFFFFGGAGRWVSGGRNRGSVSSQLANKKQAGKRLHERKHRRPRESWMEAGSGNWMPRYWPGPLSGWHVRQSFPADPTLASWPPLVLWLFQGLESIFNLDSSLPPPCLLVAGKGHLEVRLTKLCSLVIHPHLQWALTNGQTLPRAFSKGLLTLPVKHQLVRTVGSADGPRSPSVTALHVCRCTLPQPWTAHRWVGTEVSRYSHVDTHTWISRNSHVSQDSIPWISFQTLKMLKSIPSSWAKRSEAANWTGPVGPGLQTLSLEAGPCSRDWGRDSDWKGVKEGVHARRLQVTRRKQNRMVWRREAERWRLL